ncbi:hypothetical protein X943_003537 [Babesia divergens]|uniref:Uncharacterized protein n=1 Tax=Babesia divergens TaxID=32595 RepID=A0AAD9GIN5_BABDI|nr:hypothetical protein X943_003537 [Babesia divergens]
MKVSRTLITVALCLVSLGHSGQGVLGDNSVGRRLSGQEDVLESSPMPLGDSESVDPDGPVPSGFFGSVKYAFREFYNDSKVFCIGLVGLIVLLIVSGIAVACVKPDNWYVWLGAGALCSMLLVCILLYYSKPPRPVP